MDGKTLLTVLLAMAAMVSAVGVVVMGNAVRSALCLVTNFFCLAFLYFILNAEFLGIVQIVVYTGAIMVLFLFVVMLLASRGPHALTESRDLRRLLVAPFAAMLFLLVVVQVAVPLAGLSETNTSAQLGSPRAIGQALFTQYAWPIEIVGVLLLVGIMGSILLAKRKI